MKSPAFQFYVRDWLCSLTVQRMTGDQVKAYMYLLCASWLENPRGTLPTNDEDLAMLARIQLDQWIKIKDVVMKCFSIRDNRWVSEKLLHISDIQYKRASVGKGGGEKARGKSGRKSSELTIFDTPTIANPIANEIANLIAKPIPNQIANLIAEKSAEKSENGSVENFAKIEKRDSWSKSSNFPQTGKKEYQNELQSELQTEYTASASAFVLNNTNTNNSFVFEEIKKFFNFDDEIKFAGKWFEINAFLNELSKEKKIDNFKHQFEFYKKYKKASGEKIHSFKSFINGEWDAENWKSKFDALKKSDVKSSNKVNIDEIKH